MTKTTVQPDSLFQVFIKDFAAAFGIQNPAELETQKEECTVIITIDRQQAD